MRKRAGSFPLKRILVTGGAGFIGSHLVRKLASEGHDVVVIDDLSSGRLENLKSCDVDFRLGSILDAPLLERAVAGCDCIFHLAALVSVQDSVQRWEEAHEINLVGTLNVFQAALKSGTIPVVYASSAAVYGDQGASICSDVETLPRPISPYGADKLACEHQARAFAQNHDLATFGFRFFNVYGPGQSAGSPYSGVISRFVDNLINGRTHTIFGDGAQTRDFIYVGDIVHGLMAGMQHLERHRGCHVSNLCIGTSIRLLDLVDALDEIQPGSGEGLQFQAGRASDIRYSKGCTKNMTRLLGDIPRTDLFEGLRAVVSFSQTQRG